MTGRVAAPSLSFSYVKINDRPRSRVRNNEKTEDRFVSSDNLNYCRFSGKYITVEILLAVETFVGIYELITKGIVIVAPRQAKIIRSRNTDWFSLWKRSAATVVTTGSRGQAGFHVSLDT